MSGINPFNSNFLNPFSSRLQLSNTSDWSGFVKDVQSEYINSFLDLSKEDYFSDDKNPKINDLFKSIASQTADELLDLGYEKDMAITKSVEEYIKGLSIGKNSSGPMAQTNRNLVVADRAGQSSFLNYQDIAGNSLELSAGISDDIINLGGDKNLVILNLEEGNNHVNIDDKKDSDFVILGGDGEDEITLTGNISDYQFTDNGDDTLTLKNFISGATTTIDNSVAGINLKDGSRLVFKDGKLSIQASDNADVLNLTGDNTTYEIDTLDGYDSVYIGGDGNTIDANLGGGKDMAYIDGSNNIVNLELGSLSDRVYIAAGDNNLINIDGGTYTDNIIMQGQSSDWTIDGSGAYVNNTTGTVVNLSNTENVYFAADINEAKAIESNIDLTTYENTSLVLNISDEDDVVNVGGIGNNMVINLEEGNNVVNVDDSSVNVFYVNAGEGDNTINLTGNLGDYRFQDNKNGTYSILNNDTYAQIIVDKDVNNVTLADSSVVTFDGEKFTLKGTIQADGVNIDGDGSTYVVNTYNGNDDVYIAGENNDVTVLLHNDDDSVFVAAGENNNVKIDGAHGNDSLTLQGIAEDWSIHGDGSAGTYYLNEKSGTKVTIYTGIENISFDNAIVYFDDEDNAANLDFTGYDDTDIVINTGDRDDVINLDGSGNTVDIKLVAGDNIVNIDDTEGSNYTILGGTGTDTLNLVDDFSNYDVVYNPDDTATLTNTVSGTVITMDVHSIESISFNGEIKDPLELDGLVINGTSDDDTLNVNEYNGEKITINAFEGNDTINVSGLGNETTINITSGESTINIDDSELSSYTVNGGVNADVVTLTGNVADYSVIDNGDGSYSITNNVSGTTVDINDVELVEVQDGVLVGDAGTVTVEETSSTVTLDGTTGNDAFVVDAADTNDYIINGGNGTDSVVLAGVSTDWAFDRETDTYTNIATGQAIEINGVETVSFADTEGFVDIHSESASLLGVTTDFNQLVVDEGASAAYSHLSDVYGQLRDEMTLQGLTDQATTFDMMSSAAYNQSLIARDLEEMIDATDGDPTALAALALTANDTFVKPEGWDDTYFSFEANTTQTANRSIQYAAFSMGDATLASAAAMEAGLDQDKLAFELYNSYENIMSDAALSDDVKALTQELTSANGNMGEALQNVMGNVFLSSGWDIDNTTRDVITGEVYYQLGPADILDKWDTYDNFSAEIVSSFTDGLVNVAAGEDYSSFMGTTGSDELSITGGFENIGALDLGYGSDTLTVEGHNNSIGSVADRLLMGDGDDTLIFDGFNNDAYIDMGAGDDTIFYNFNGTVDEGLNNLNVTGGAGEDTLVLGGSASDWTYDDATKTYSVNVSTKTMQTVTIDDTIENVLFSDDIDADPIIFSGTGAADIIDARGIDYGEVIINAGNGADTIYIDNSNSTKYTIDLGGDTKLDEVITTDGFLDYDFINNGDGSYTFKNDTTGSEITLLNVGAGDKITNCDGDCANCSGECTFTMRADGKFDSYIQDLDGTDTEYLVTGLESLDYVEVHDSGGNDTLTLEGSVTDWTYDRNTGIFTHNTFGTEVELFNEIENVQFIDDMGPIDLGETVDINFTDVSLTGVTTDFNKLVAEEGASAGFAHLSDLYGQLSTQLADEGLADQALMFDKLSSATNNMSVVAAEYEKLILVTGGDEQAMIDLWNDRNDDFTKPVGWDDTYYDFDANVSQSSIERMTYAAFAVGYATIADATEMANALAQDKIAYEAYDTYDSIMNDATLSQEIKDLTTELFSATGNMGETFQNRVGDVVLKAPNVTSDNTTIDVITGESFHQYTSADMAVRYDDFVNYNASNVTGFTGALQNISTGEDYSSYTATTGDDSLEIAGGFSTIGSIDMLAGDDFVEITAHNSIVGSTSDRVNLGDGADTLIMTGFNTDAYADMGAGNDTIYVGGGTTKENNTMKTLDVLGGAGDDTLILEGSSSDWTFDSATQTYHSYNSPDTRVKINSIENVVYSDDIVTINGTSGEDYIDATDYVNQTVNINALEGPDRIYLDNLSANNYTINLGSDSDGDRVYVDGKIEDYTLVDNGDETYTLTNNLSGSIINLNQLSSNDSVAFDDGYMHYDASKDNWGVSLEDTTGDDTYNISDPSLFEGMYFNGGTSVNDKLIINDTIANWDHVSDVEFTETVLSTDTESIEFNGMGTVEFNDAVFVRGGSSDDNIDLTSYGVSGKDIEVLGGDGLDTVTLAGSYSDWSYDEGTSIYTNVATGQTAKITDVETVNFVDGNEPVGPPVGGGSSTVTIDGTLGSNTIDATSYDNSEITINSLGGNDTIDVGGTGNTNIINSGTGNDVINLLGSDNVSTVNLGSGNDSILVGAGEVGAANTVTLLGGTGDDTLTLEGAEIDWAYDDATSTYTNNITGTTVEAVDFENVEYTAIGLAGNIDDYIIHDRVADGVIKIEDRASGDIVNATDGDMLKFADGSILEVGVGDNTVTITGTDSGSYVEVDDTYGQGIYNATLGDGDDTFIMTGSANITNSDLGAGDDTVFISEGDLGDANSAVLEGGIGNDTLILDGDEDNWTFNGTDTYTNVHTGTTVQATGFENVVYQDNATHLTGSINDYIIHDRVDDGVIKIEDRSTGTTYDMDNGDIIEFEDGSRLKMDIYGFVDITNSDIGNLIEIDDTYGFGRYNAILGDGDDTFIMTGSKNLSDSNLGAGDDTAYISAGAVGEANNVVLNGGEGTDRLTLEGSAVDWTFNGTNTYTHNTTGSSVRISNFENVRFEADSININGTTGNDDIYVNGYTDESIVVNALEGQDDIYLDDSAATNDFTINLGNDSSNDRVYLDGNIEDYTMADNGDETYTLTNNVSGSTITLNELSASDTVFFNNAAIVYESDDNWDVHLNDTSGADTYNLTDFASYEDIHFNNATSVDDTLIINDSISNWTLNASNTAFYESNAATDTESIEIGGIGTVEFDDFVLIKAGSTNDNFDLAGIDTSKDIKIVGGDGIDTLNLTGASTDWTYDRATDTYTHNTTSQTVAINGVENVTYSDDSDIVDLHYSDFSLLGVTTDFNQLASDSSYSGTFEHLSTIYSQMSDELTAQGLTDQALRLDKMASALHNTSLVAAEYEQQVADSGGDLTALQAIRHTTVTKPAGWDDTYYSWENNTTYDDYSSLMDATFNLGEIPTKDQATYDSRVAEDMLAYVFDSEYQATMSDAALSSEFKDVIQNVATATSIVSEDIDASLAGLFNSARDVAGTTRIYDYETGESWDRVVSASSADRYDLFNNYTAESVVGFTDVLVNSVYTDYDSLSGTNNADNYQITTGNETISGLDMMDGNDVLTVDGFNNVLGSAADRLLMGAGDDTLYVTGYNNNVYADLGAGDDTVVINTFGDQGIKQEADIIGGDGTDTVVLDGSSSDWTFNGTDTYTHNINDSVIKVDGTVENVVFSDTIDSDTVIVNGTTSNDQFTIDASDTSDYLINGSDGADNLTLAGASTDWTFDRDTDVYTNIATGQTIEINDIETVNFADSAGRIDIHSESASLLGVTTNFNNLVATDGASAAYSQISSMYAQLRDEMTLQGLTDQATTFDKMASAAYNQSLVAAEYESMIDATGGDLAAVQALYDSRFDTFTEPAGWDSTYYTFEENTIRDYIYDMATMGAAASSGSLSTIVANEDRLVYELYYEYENVMGDAAISDDVKALTQELTSADGNMGESFQNNVSNLIYISPTSGNSNSAQDAITGDNYAAYTPSDLAEKWELYTNYEADNVSSFTDGLVNIAAGEDYSSFAGTAGADQLEISTGFENISAFDMGDGNDNLSIEGHNNYIGSSGDRVLMGAGNDVLNFDGMNNDAYVDMGTGDDTVFVRNEGRSDGNINTLDVLGGAGNDTLILEGASTDWQWVDADTYISRNTGVTVNHSGFENLIYSDDGISIYTGTSGSDVYESTTNNNLGVVSTAAGEDYVSFSGSDNEVTIRLGDGNDLAEIDTSGNNSSYIVDAGSGYDALMLSGNVADYDVVDNGDGTFTATDRVSGTTVTYDSTVENIIAQDGLLYDRDNDDYALFVHNSDDQEIHLEQYDGIMIEGYLEGGNDTVYMGGDTGQYIGLGTGDDTAYIDASDGGTFHVIGQGGNDTVNITGSIDDYTIGQNDWSNGDFVKLINNVTGAKIYVKDADTVNFEDGSKLENISSTSSVGNIVGTSGDDIVDVYDIIGAGDDTYNAQLGDGNDSFTIEGTDLESNVDLGAGDDNIYVGRGLTGYEGTSNTIVAEGGTGYDTLTLQGSAVEWTYDSSTSTYTNIQTDTTVEATGFENVVYDESDTTTIAGTIDDYYLNGSGSSVKLVNKTTSEVITLNTGTVIFDGDGGLLTNTKSAGRGIFYSGPGNVESNITEAYEFGMATGDGDDDITIEGYNHAGSDIFLGAGDDTIYISRDTLLDGQITGSDLNIFGEGGNDTLILEGAAEEWTYDGVGRYYNLATDLTVDVNSIENVIFDDSNVTYAAGSSNEYVITNDSLDSGVNPDISFVQDGSVVFTDGATLTVDDNSNDVSFVGTSGNDTVTFDDDVAGGKHIAYLQEGNDTINIDDSVAGSYDIYGGDGTDTVNLAGDTSDYTVVANGGGAYTLTNNVSGAVIKINSDVENVYDGFSTIMDLAGLANPTG